MLAPANILNLLLLALLAGLDPTKVGAGRAPRRAVPRPGPGAPADGGFAGLRGGGARRALPARMRQRAATRLCRAAGWLRGEAGARPWAAGRPGGGSSWRKRLSPVPGLPASRREAGTRRCQPSEGLRARARRSGARGTGAQSARTLRPPQPRPPRDPPAPPQAKVGWAAPGGGGGAVGTAGAGQGGAGLIPRWRPAAVQPEGAATSPTQGKEVWTVLGGCTGSGEAARRWKQGSTASDGEYSCFEWNRRRHVKTLVPVLEARSGLLQSFVIFKCVQVTKRSRLIPE